MVAWLFRVSGVFVGRDVSEQGAGCGFCSHDQATQPQILRGHHSELDPMEFQLGIWQ